MNTSSTDRMLTRVKSIYLFIRKKGIVETEELVEEFGITHRTIQRDLNILSHYSLVKSPKRGYWKATSKRVKIN